MSAGLSFSVSAQRSGPDPASHGCQPRSPSSEASRIVRVPAARVAVRLPGTLPDFFRQRIRIEMGKVQLARQYPELAARGAPQPRARAALASLGPGGLVRLAAYLGLRSAAHAVAWWRYRRGATAGIWRQAATTKRWDLV